MQSVPKFAKAKGTEKELLLRYFIEGVNSNNDTGVIHKEKDILLEADVAVIQGWVHNKFDSPHLKLRKEIIDYCRDNEKHIVSADANLFLYASRDNHPHHYLRYSFDGVFPNTGIYCDSNIDKTRWKKISNNLDIKIESKKTGNNILLCCQRNGGWSMGNENLFDWITDTVQEIQKYSDRHIVLRPHPGDKDTLAVFNAQHEQLKRLKNISISKINSPIEEDLQNTWAVVNHNSSSIVGPIIYGYHAFITDPNSSQCAEVSHSSFEFLETPKQFDRLRWLERISMFHWSFDELRSGECWSHMKEYL